MVRRCVFNSSSQEEEEEFDTYLAARCNFGNLQDELIRDRLILGIHSEETRKKLLATDGLTLETAIPLCRSEETACMTLHSFLKQDDETHSDNIQAISTGYKNKQPDRMYRMKCKFCGL